MNTHAQSPMKKQDKEIRRVLASALRTLAISYLSIARLSGAPPMEPIYDIHEAVSLKPSEHKIGGSTQINLFPVPQDGAVGTNSLKNSITICMFSKNGMRSINYFHNAVSGMSPSGQYMPLLSKDAIGYGMTRGFTIFDFTRKKIRDFTIHTSIDRDIEKVRATDAEKNLFLFWSKEDEPDAGYLGNTQSFLRLFDLSGEKPVLLEKRQLQDYETWNVYNNNVFLCDFDKNELTVFDSTLKPSSHPLVDIINKNKGTADFAMIVPHPTLPFAIFYGGGYCAQYVCWNQTFRDEKIQSIFGTDPSTLYYTFSADGKWVVFLADEFSPKRSYIMPVSEKYPNYLGSPILLEGDYFDRDKFAWTNNPVSLVGASNGKLLRYDLTKEGHPEAEGYPSYWDYVVEKDLEKLRAQGKQGLKPKP